MLLIQIKTVYTEQGVYILIIYYFHKIYPKIWVKYKFLNDYVNSKTEKTIWTLHLYVLVS